MNRNGEIWIFVILYVGALALLVSSGKFVLAGILALSLFALQLLRLNDKLIYWIFFLGASNAMFPVSAMKVVPVALLVQILFVGKTILDWIIQPETRPKFRGTDLLLMGIIILLAVTSVVRGAGFYALGGSSTGGAEYLERIIGFFFLFVAAMFVRGNNFSPKTGMLFFLYGTIVKVVVNIATKVLPSPDIIARFFDIRLREGAWISVEGAALRLPFIGALPIALLPFVMSRSKFSERLFLGGACVVISMMSGFRSGMVGIVMLFIISEMYMYRFTFTKVLVGIVLGGISYVMLWVTAPLLGFRIQRVLLAVPGFESRVSADVSFDASASTEWRMRLYEECIKKLPDYAIIGRGFGDSLTDLVGMLHSFSIGNTNAELYFYTHAYHLAIFDLLIDYGGVVTVFLLSSIMYLINKSKVKKYNMSSYEKYAVAYLISAIIAIGTVWSNFYGRFIYISLAFIISNSFLFKSSRAPGIDNSDSAKRI
jgi:hypothetical protein